MKGKIHSCHPALEQLFIGFHKVWLRYLFGRIGKLKLMAFYPWPGLSSKMIYMSSVWLFPKVSKQWTGTELFFFGGNKNKLNWKFYWGFVSFQSFVSANLLLEKGNLFNKYRSEWLQFIRDKVKLHKWLFSYASLNFQQSRVNWWHMWFWMKLVIVYSYTG